VVPDHLDGLERCTQCVVAAGGRFDTYTMCSDQLYTSQTPVIVRSVEHWFRVQTWANHECVDTLPPNKSIGLMPVRGEY
jgi:hypothetical protein